MIRIVRFVFVVWINIPWISCSGRCLHAYNDLENRIANCSLQGLTSIPWNLDINTAVLHLEHNNITELSEFALKKYSSIKELYLKNNKIRTISQRVFSDLKALLILDLSSNRLSSVPTPIFHYLPSLLSLFLNGNNIYQLNAYAFYNLSQLTMLQLKGNHIMHIDGNAFAGLKNLHHLDLQSNSIISMGYQTLTDSMATINEIHLHNNPWACDCRIRWLMDWLSFKNSNVQWRFNGKEPICQGPHRVQRKPMSSLPRNMFACEIQPLSGGSTLTLATGEHAQLICKLFADPPAQITWYKNGVELIPPQEESDYIIVQHGLTRRNSSLYLYNFQYDNIGKYVCRAENTISYLEITFTLTLPGVDPDSITLATTKQSSSINTNAAMIGGAAVAILIFIIVIIVIIVYLAVKRNRLRREKEDAIRRQICESQFKMVNSNGVISNQVNNNPHYPYKPSPISGFLDQEEMDPLYESVPARNQIGRHSNTYISFKTDPSDPEDLPQLYSTRNAGHRDESQSESTSPLLDHLSPIAHESSSDPLYEAAMYRNTLPHSQTVSPSLDSYCTTPTSRGKPYKSNSMGSIGLLHSAPPKPPRLYASRDSMSISTNDSVGVVTLLPRPGTVDEYGTAV